MAGDVVTPGSLVLRGSTVILRAWRPEELDRWAEIGAEPDLGTEIGGPGTSFAWAFGPPPMAVLRKRIENSGRFHQSLLELAVEAHGQVAGSIQARNPRECFVPGTFMIGINLATASRGRGVGREAVALLASHLFEEEGAERVEMPTDVENVPMRTVAERLGFPLEGVMRSFMPMGDMRRDHALYAITRADWENVRSTWTFRS